MDSCGQICGKRADSWGDGGLRQTVVGRTAHLVHRKQFWRRHDDSTQNHHTRCRPLSPSLTVVRAIASCRCLLKLRRNHARYFLNGNHVTDPNGKPHF